jgi:hypothetical protein
MTYKELVEYHIYNNFWKSEFDKRYGYVLSPEPFVLNDEIKSQLLDIGKVIKVYQEGCKNLFSLAKNEHGRLFNTINYIFKSACEGLPLLQTNRNSALCKVDLIIDEQNQLKILEVDIYNPRGIPYVVFLRDIFKEYRSNYLIGVESVIKRELNNRATSSLLWVYADKERYYENGFLQLKRILQNNLGINVLYMNALNIEDKEGKFNAILNVPACLNKPTEIITRGKLVREYKKDDNKFLYPIIPWMGSKSLLGIISNASKIQSVDELVFESFENIELLRNYIPPSILIGKYFKDDTKKWVSSNNDSVLKKSVSSGHKNVYFSDDINFHTNIESALSHKQPAYILQKCIKSKKILLPYFEKNGKISKDYWNLRLTVHVDLNGDVVDAEITGRRDQFVYGSIDSIQLPCII